MKYLIKRIFSMNFKNFFKTINDIHFRTNKSRVVIFFDIVYCGIKYKAGYVDYKLFNMYKMNNKERATIITRGVNNDYIKALNDQSKISLFHDKIKFNNTFKKYLNRDYLVLNDNYNDFLKFIGKHNEIIAKPIDGSCGKGIEKIKVSKNKERQTYNKLINNGQVLLEEVAIQNEEIAKFHPYSINTLRVVTIYGEVVAAFIRIGNKKHIVDNFNSEGLCAPINIETGKIEYPAIDKAEHLYYSHPITKVKIVGEQVPMWNKVKKLVKEASTLSDGINYVGWDVCVGEKKPFLIEANEFPGHDIYQLPPHRSNNYGLKPLFDKAIENTKNN